MIYDWEIFKIIDKFCEIHIGTKDFIFFEDEIQEDTTIYF